MAAGVTADCSDPYLNGTNNPCFIADATTTITLPWIHENNNNNSNGINNNFFNYNESYIIFSDSGGNNASSYSYDTDINGGSSSSSNISNQSAANGNNSHHPMLSREATASFIALYTMTTLFAIVGNILVVIVFANGRRCKTDIRPFLINLAVADLILAIFCMPFTFTFAMMRHWIFSAPMCPIVLCMQHLSVSASVFTNMAIGIDRFLVVTFPLQARLTIRRAKYTIGVIWLSAAILSSVQMVVARVHVNQGNANCGERWSSENQRKTFTISVLLITYIVPLVILSVTYSIVSVIMWKRTAPGNAHEGRDHKQLKAKRKVIKMLVLIVIMFALCWLPLHTFFLVLDFNPQISENNSGALTLIFYVVHWLAMSNSCANPIIYGFMNDSFRADLATLCYMVFPFCQCLKKISIRRFSSSTHGESTYNKRFSTVRRSPINALYQQAPYRHGSKVYIELKRDTSRERSLGSMNDFFHDGKNDRYGRNMAAAPLAPRRGAASAAVVGVGVASGRRPQSYLRQESGESTQSVSFTPPSPDPLDAGQSRTSGIPSGNNTINSNNNINNNHNLVL